MNKNPLYFVIISQHRMWRSFLTAVFTAMQQRSRKKFSAKAGKNVALTVYWKSWKTPALFTPTALWLIQCTFVCYKSIFSECRDISTVRSETVRTITNQNIIITVFTKNYLNWLMHIKVTASKKVGNFLAHSVDRETTM